jgi:hypothetical protein
MVIKMTRTHVMPFGCFRTGMEYDTNKVENLTVGQAKTFVACESAIDVTPKPKARKVKRDGSN